MELLIICLLCAGIGAAIGSSKGLTGTGFLLGLLLGAIGIIIVVCMKGNRQNCPYCKTVIPADATVCKSCGREVVK